MRLISAEMVDGYLEHGYCFLIDLRSPQQYQKAHIRNAVNLPFEEMEEWQDRLNKELTLILYCEWGSSSVAAGRRLSHAGYRVLSVIGGFRAYHGKYR